MNKFLIRFFDFIFSLTGLIILFPFFLIMGLMIILDSKGKIFYKQKRVGQNGNDFLLYKFRSMRSGSDKKSLLTVGKDERITRTGNFLRKYKLDELPQLINVLKSEMSLVGPRPEVRKYVGLYNEEQKKILHVKPGITDFASIEFANENELLATSSDPEKLYIEKIMPEKIKLNRKFISAPTLKNYFLILGKTFLKIFS